MTPTLVIDLLGFTGGRGGTETYAREVIPRLTSLLAGVELRALVSTPGRDLVREFFPGDVLEMKGVGDSPASWAKGEVFLAERAARSLGASAIWTPANFGPIRRGLPRVVTIHDLIYHQIPGPLSQRPFRRATAELMSRSARTADAVISVSEATADEVHRRLAVPRSRLHVVPHGTTPPPEVASPPARRGDLVLSTGNRMPHKNHVGLLEAVARMEEGSRPSVVITGGGSDDPLAAHVRRLGLEGVVDLPGWVSHDELERLYSQASVYVCPSLLEGFGLPVLDALARGCVVVANDIPVLREVGGSECLYVDATDADALGRAIRRGLALDGDVQRRERGRHWAAGFTWEASAAGTAAVLSHVLRLPAPTTPKDSR
jgi:glycosyltransferase involved in cell wall biosynthesis